MHPIENSDIKDQLLAAIISTLEAHDAPPELYERFNLKRLQLTQSSGEKQNEML